MASAVLLRTSAAVDEGDCRHECDDEEKSHQEDHGESDHVPTMTTVQHQDLRMTHQVLPFPLDELLVFRVFFGLHGVAASFVIEFARPCIALCGNVFLQKYWLIRLADACSQNPWSKRISECGSYCATSPSVDNRRTEAQEEAEREKKRRLQQEYKGALRLARVQNWTRKRRSLTMTRSMCSVES